MAITALDIKMRKSQRLTDNPDGGGRMVQAEIVDGELNNLFPDIGDEERTTGRSTLRKMFVHVDTPNTDVLKDAIAVIIAPPEDSNVHVSMFGTGSYSDERAQARQRVEAYITKGVESRFVLLGDHYIGQQAISVYCMKDAPTPDIGDNLCLATSASGYTELEQYIRVRSILARTTQTFHDQQGAFERDVIIIESESALIYDFYGQEVNRRTDVKPPTRVHETNNIAAATYYSVRHLATPGAPGDLTVNVGSPYVPIVPSTTAETPIVDQLAGLGTVAYVQSGAADLLTHAYSASFGAGVAVTRFLGSPMVRGSVSATVGGTLLQDNGDGGLAAEGASPWSGTIDYGAGSIAIAHASGTGSTSVSLTATPAGPVVDQGHTREVAISTNNQAYNYVLTLTPLPAAGTVVVDYRALGRWIRLADDGNGRLVGKPGQGSGTVNYATGTVVVTLGALPDLDSSLLASWGTGVMTARRDGSADIRPPHLNFMLEHAGITPGTFELTYQVSAAAQLVTDDGAGTLLLAGAPVGSIVYATGEVGLRPPTLPDDNSTLLVDYEWASLQTQPFTPTADSGGLVALSLPGAPVRPGSVLLTWQVSMVINSQPTSPVSAILRARDNGAGELWLLDRPEITSAVGTINYTTGAISLKVGGNRLRGYVSDFIWIEDDWVSNLFANTLVDSAFGSGSLVTAEYVEASAADTAVIDEFTLPPVVLELTRGIINPVLPGSLRFTFRGRTYVDRNGSLYHSIDPVNGAGTYAGSIDYGTGKATITSWAAGGSNAVTVGALLVRGYEAGTASTRFRANGAPLRIGSASLRATTLGGVLLTATSDLNGNLLGAGVEGKVNWDTGVVSVRFGEMVPVAGNENEDWFDPGNVVGSDVWRPLLVSAGTIYLNAVAFRSIPMSPVVVGLDPVRLPADGLVPAYRPGQTVLVHHTQETTVASPAANLVTDLGRGRIAQIEVRDSAGTPVDSIWWTADLDAGTVTWADPLNLSAYVLPVVIRDRIEDRRLVAEVQINGDIALNSGLTHDFPSGEAMVSTAFRLGEPNGSLDLQARVQGLFDLATWNPNIWLDTPGPGQTPAPATFNDTDFPLVVTNADAITERWALVFTNSTSFNIVGETVGVIGTGTTTADCAPINPRTGLPYFTVPREGWGIGWATNNAVRFNTIGGLAPLWIVRTTIAGTPEQMVDGFRLQVLGNIAEAV